MLHLLLPDATRLWTDFPAAVPLDELAESPELLGELAFIPSEERVETLEIRVALRHGVAHPLGLLADYQSLEPIRHLLAVVRDHHQAQHAHAAVAALPVDELMDRLFPGWNTNGVTMLAGVGDSTVKQLEELWRRIEHDLQATPPREDLVHHWVALGAAQPDPI